MYLPPHFEEHRPDELHRVIREHSLGTLVLRAPSGLDANHIPFLLHEDEAGGVSLRAHVARANALWHEAQDGDEALVIFRAANAYISPNWYPSKHEHHRQVPTWNYQAVHVHGRIYIHDDAKFIRGVVGRLTRTHETRAGEERPWKMSDSAPDFIDAMVAAVVGIEIRIDRMIGKWKLGQNKEERDRHSAAEQLMARGDALTAAAMRTAERPERT